jgi:DNA (cytosine-5)-methyltransferase 1
MTYGSLFTGIGGLDLGMDRAGWQCRWQVENDPYCTKVLEKHWPDVKRYGDIRAVTGDELEPVDLICGGFPCQDLSQAGKRAGIEGTRSGLWFEFARLVGRLRPRYVLIENVPGLLVSDAMRRVVGELARLGYVGCWRSLRASEFGASHLRKRVFIVAYNSGAGGWIDCGSGERPDSEGGREVHNGRSAPQTQRVDAGGGDVAYAGEAVAFRFSRIFDGERAAFGDDADGCDPELGHPERARWTQAGIGRDEHAGREPEAGRGMLENAHALQREQPAGQRSGPGDAGVAGAHDQPAGPSIGLAFAPGPSDPRWPRILRERPDLAPALESEIRGVAPRLPDWMDGAMSDRTKRLGRLGNAVVPQISQWIAERIARFDEVTNGPSQ